MKNTQETLNSTRTANGLLITKQEDIIEILNSQLSMDKGLIVISGPGTGKTTIVSQWIKSLKRHPYNYLSYTASGLVAKVKEANDISYIYETFKKLRKNPDKGKHLSMPLFIDDLGTEAGVNMYGEKHNVIKEAVETAYQHKIPFFATTNLPKESKNGNSLSLEYGDHVMSRFNEMCEFVYLDEPDYRLLENQKIQEKNERLLEEMRKSRY